MSFNWRTEEERGWDKERYPDAPNSPAPRRKSLWRVALLITTLTVVTAAFWLAVRERTERILRQLEQEVQSSYTLAQQAVAQGDSELLLTVLSGSDQAWAETQYDLLQEQLLLGRAATAFGLTVGENNGTVVTHDWSPDLQEVTVTVRHNYSRGKGADAEAVILEQMMVFRRGGQRWLLSPPESGSWGPSGAHQGRYVQLTFQERDAQAAAEMLPVLEQALERLCRRLARECAEDETLTVRLSADPEALWRLREERYAYFRRGILTLPAPSLVGEGVDALSKQALYEGYAQHVLVAATRVLLEVDCCAGAPFLDALAVELAQEMGYGSQTRQGTDFIAMVADSPTLDQFHRLWWGAVEKPFTGAARRDASVFVAFLKQQSGASTDEILAALAQTSGYWAWSQQFVAHDVSLQRSALDNAWRDYILAEANAAQADLAAYELQPEQALKLICEDTMGQRGVYGYDPRGDRWTFERVVRARAPALVPAPGDTAVVLYDRVSGDPARLPARLLQGGRAVALDGDLAPAYSVPGDPQGRFMPMWRIAQSGRTVDGIVLLDLQACLQQSGCMQRSLAGLPAWSPSGEQLLIWDPDLRQVMVADRDFENRIQPPLRSSQQPFWLTENLLGYVSEDGQVIEVTGPQDDGRAQPLLTLRPVLQALGREGDGRAWRFAQAYAVPNTARSIAGAITLPQSGARHYFAAHFDEEGELRELVPLTYAPQLTVTSPEALISPDGAWLALHLGPEALFEALFVLHDLHTGDVVLETRSPYFISHTAHDWSEDGRWLARIGVNHFELATRSGDEARPLLRRFVSSGELQCSSVVWVHR